VKDEEKLLNGLLKEKKDETKKGGLK